MPLGQGDVPWPHYCNACVAGGYDGVFAIEREVGDDPVADIAKPLRITEILRENKGVTDERTNYTAACIGCGSIAQHLHLPGYAET